MVKRGFQGVLGSSSYIVGIVTYDILWALLVSDSACFILRYLFRYPERPNPVRKKSCLFLTPLKISLCLPSGEGCLVLHTTSLNIEKNLIILHLFYSATLYIMKNLHISGRYLCDEMSCCPSGSWGALIETSSEQYTPKGSITTCGDLDIYHVGEATDGKCILWNYDIFGLNGGRTRMLCDIMADQVNNI